jgi:hypothetical protein
MRVVSAEGKVITQPNMMSAIVVPTPTQSMVRRLSRVTSTGDAGITTTGETISIVGSGMGASKGTSTTGVSTIAAGVSSTTEETMTGSTSMGLSARTFFDFIVLLVVARFFGAATRFPFADEVARGDILLKNDQSRFFVW